MTDHTDPRSPLVKLSTVQFYESVETTDPTGFVLAEDKTPAWLDAQTRYWIREELGRGGGGIVYRAYDEGLGRDVAIKILRCEYLSRPKIVARFVREAQLIVSLRHPGIPQVYDFGTCPDGRPFYSTRIVEGQDLGKRLDAARADERAELLGVFSQVCQIMAYTHAQELVHLDLKPDNVMVGKFGEVLLMDWGHAQRLSAHTPDYARNIPHAGGTLAYMAPEHAAGTIPTKQFDVFSLGATLCHILTGDPPYLGDSREEAYKLALAADLDPALARLHESGFDSQLIRMAQDCLSVSPHDRPRDAGEVAQAMADYFKSALERYKSDIQRFFDISCDLFCIAGFDGCFHRVNVNFPTMLGYSERELLSQPFLEWVHPEDREQTQAQMAILFEGKPVVRFRNRYRTANGEFLLLEWTAKSIPAEKIIYAVARVV